MAYLLCVKDRSTNNCLSISIVIKATTSLSPSNTLNISRKSLVPSLATIRGSDHSPEKGFAEKLSTLGNGRKVSEK